MRRRRAEFVDDENRRKATHQSESRSLLPKGTMQLFDAFRGPQVPSEPPSVARLHSAAAQRGGSGDTGHGHVLPVFQRMASAPVGRGSSSGSGESDLADAARRRRVMLAAAVPEEDEEEEQTGGGDAEMDAGQDGESPRGIQASRLDTSNYFASFQPGQAALDGVAVRGQHYHRHVPAQHLPAHTHSSAGVPPAHPPRRGGGLHRTRSDGDGAVAASDVEVSTLPHGVTPLRQPLPLARVTSEGSELDDQDASSPAITWADEAGHVHGMSLRPHASVAPGTMQSSPLRNASSIPPQRRGAKPE
jgi:hypothetical protein